MKQKEMDKFLSEGINIKLNGNSLFQNLKVTRQDHIFFDYN